MGVAGVLSDPGVRMLAFYSFLVCPVLSGSPPTTATCIYRYLPHKWFGIISAVQRSQDGLSSSLQYGE